MFFWNSLAFSMIQQMLAIWYIVPLSFLNPACTSGNSRQIEGKKIEAVTDFILMSLMEFKWFWEVYVSTRKGQSGNFGYAYLLCSQQDHSNSCPSSWNTLVFLENPLDCKEIKPVHPKGNQSWIFIRRMDAEAETPILWPPEELTH